MKTDFLIIGGGVIGLSIALAVKKRHPQAHLVVIEKEKSVGMHASGRNSGVLHAGFYYTADSLKARFTREGNRRLTEYCEEKGLQIRKCGKLVVANTEEEQRGLDELFRRGRANGVEIHEVTQKEAEEIEPLVRTHKRALFSPNTSSVDPLEVMRALEKEVRAAGIEIRYETAFLRKEGERVWTNKGAFTPGFVINAAGLYADRIAHAWGVGKRYRILPFKGLYLYAQNPPPLRTHIYPVPNLRNPFLGVHFTLTVAGGVKIGPTAIPALWREQYRGFENFKLSECCAVALRQAALLRRKEFRALGWEEVKKYRKQHLATLSNALVRTLNTSTFSVWGKAGIRAQLFDLKKKALEMDFVIERGERSCHILNAVSPAFTCAFPFADHLLDEIEVI